MHIPKATYRIQFNYLFDFAAAKKVVRYLSELGISDIYAAPIFKARKSSMHGYDIVDPNQINPELGGCEGFETLIAELKSRNMHWLQDIVPNHMAYDSENRILMDVLEKGKCSRYFKFFDIDWNHPHESLNGRLLAPFLGRFYAESLEEGQIRLQYDEEGLSVCYYELKFPLNLKSYTVVFTYNIKSLEDELGANNPDLVKFLGFINFIGSMPAEKQNDEVDVHLKHAKKMLWDFYTQNEHIRKFMDTNVAFFNGKKGLPASFDSLDCLLHEQFFRLSFWKVAAEEINYRRFFNVNRLISLKVEDWEVFDYVHELTFRFIREGKFTGLRIDHVDGLYDPAAYLKRLKENAGDIYIVVEKILDFKEHLPRSWNVEGTTGYDFLNRLNGIFCRKEGEKEFTRLYYKVTGLHTSYEELVCDKKRMFIGRHMAGNIDNLAQEMKRVTFQDRYGKDITLYGLKRALVEIMAVFPVYRTYISQGVFRESDRKYFKEAFEKARKNSPRFEYEINFIEKFLLFDSGKIIDSDLKEKFSHFIMIFQQYTAPLMAKGFEDTVLYIYNKLISLNEVGGNPSRFSVSLKDFHSFCEYRRHSLNATSTHDTKRGEDVRARINVLSEIPKEWKYHLINWIRINKPKKRFINKAYAPDANDEYFLYQTLIGTFPFSMLEFGTFNERIREYIRKAVREAKVHTAWIKPDIEYEEACMGFVDSILEQSEDNRFLREFVPFQKKVAFFGILNSLSQKLVAITSPGVPDFYQGTELWDFSLVDPDNRRPVDFKKRESFLTDIKERLRSGSETLIEELLRYKEDGRIKLFLIYKVLKARGQYTDVFEKGRYVPLKTEGKFKNCVIAYARQDGNCWAITFAGRFFTSLAKEGVLPLTESVWEDTSVILPKGGPVSWKNVITDEKIEGGGSLLVGKIFNSFPAALIIGNK